MNSKKKIQFMCTAFRDGLQSVYGARVFTKDLLPAIEAARDAGINYFEAGGGARFQSLYFYCNEDAFDMMDAFRKATGPNANLQTLARGVNVVGLESQPRDIIRLHAKLFKKHGITTIRNFDALNDVNNLIYSGQCITEEGLKHQICITMMELPPGCKGAHDAEFYSNTLKQILAADIPFDSICYKDASGTSRPQKVYETIKQARKILPEKTFIQFHTHETAGISVISNNAALEAGADAIDLSLAPTSGGTCSTDILVMWHALRGTQFDLDVDIDKIRKAEEVFKECMKDYFLPPEALAVEPLIPWSPMPGGALTANTQMLRDNGIMERYPDIIKAMGEVVENGGYGTSVTPVSQFYFQQAFNNVIHGSWKMIAEPYGRMVLGYFGKTPVAPNPMVIELAKKQLELEPTTIPPIEMNENDPTKGIKAAQEWLRKEKLPETEENIFIVATCKEKGIAYLKGEGEIRVRKIKPAEKSTKSSGIYYLNIDGKNYQVAVDGNKVQVDGQEFKVEMKEKPDESAPVSAATEVSDKMAIESPLPGVVFKIVTPIGTTVKKDDTLVIIEAMKMETKISSPVNGKVSDIVVTKGQQIAQGDVLAYVSVIK
jgi:pyruvate carboxylase subunit B